MIHYVTHPRLRLLFLLTVVFILLGMVLFSTLEGWGMVDSFYFTISTMTTVGYGDLVPTTDASKVLASLYMLSSVPLILISVGLVTEIVHDNLRAEHAKK